MQRKKAFTTKEISEILGIYPKTLSHWVAKGILEPEVYASRGKGTTRLFSPINVYQALVIKTLSTAEFGLDQIGDVLSYLKGKRILHMIATDPHYRRRRKHVILGRDFASQGGRYLDVVCLEDDNSEHLDDVLLLSRDFDMVSLISLRFLDEWVPQLNQAGVWLDAMEQAP